MTLRLVATTYLQDQMLHNLCGFQERGIGHILYIVDTRHMLDIVDIHKG